jgi:hypothetical protein
VTKLVSILLVLATAGTACAASQKHAAAPRHLRVPMQIGGVVPELLDAGLQDLTIGLMKQANLADVGRITVTWLKGQTAMDPGQLGDLRTGVDKATAAGVDVYLDVYPNGSSQTPNSTADQAAFATWAASVVAALPNLKHVIVGNECNLNLFCLPQYGSAGQDLAAINYTKLMARTYDAVKAAAPAVEVVGGALAHSGTDKPSSARQTHSPAQFILDMGKAYRTLKRPKPIMDAFAYHPYMERADLSPTLRHVRSKTLTIADYGKLVSVLKRAFGGTAQKGSNLPLVYDEFGVEAQVPAAQRAAYSEQEPATTHPVSEATQAAYYDLGFHLAACQPNVRAIMVFRLIDSEFLSSFQSGVFYADRQTPKSSLAPVAASARKYRAGSITACGVLLAPSPVIDWRTRTLTCDADCAYAAVFRRVGQTGPVATIRGTAVAGVDTRLPQAKLRPGRYTIALTVRATAYKANAYTTTSPPFG